MTLDSLYEVKRNYDHPAFFWAYEVRTYDNHNIYITYKKHTETKANAYTLWVEVNPISMTVFLNVFKKLAREAREINFVLCDVAFDIPVYKDDVFLVSRKGRVKIQEQNSYYFGQRKDCRQHGYLREYDKRLQLMEEKGIYLEDDLTRAEIVYRPNPDKRFPMAELLIRPPTFNRLYMCFVIGHMDDIPLKRKALIEAVMSLDKPYKEVTDHYRKQIEEDLTSTQTKVDFNEIAKQQWNDVVGLYVAIARGQATKIA